MNWWQNNFSANIQNGDELRMDKFFPALCCWNRAEIRKQKGFVLCFLCFLNSTLIFFFESFHLILIQNTPNVSIVNKRITYMRIRKTIRRHNECCTILYIKKNYHANNNNPKKKEKGRFNDSKAFKIHSMATYTLKYVYIPITYI